MKKLATILMGVVLTTSATAGSAYEAAQPGTPSSPSNAMSSAPQKAPVTSYWVSLGEATVQESFIYACISGSGVAGQKELKVEIQKHTQSEGLYRLINPYSKLPAPDDFAGLENANEYPTSVQIDASNPDCVIVKYQYSGFSEDDGEGTIHDYYICNQEGYDIKYNSKTAAQVAADNTYTHSTLKNGVITIATPKTYCYNWDNDQWEWDDIKQSATGNYVPTVITLPTGLERYVSFANICPVNDQVNIEYTVADNIAGAYIQYSETVEPNPVYENLRNTGAYVFAENGKISYTLENASSYPDGEHAILAAFYDNSGKYVDGLQHAWFNIAEVSNFNGVPSTWTSIGNATYPEVLLSSVYSSNPYGGDQFYKRNLTVEVERNDNNPNYYRLVDPYKTHPEYGSKLLTDGHVATHHHYIIFDVTNPDNVLIMLTPLGFDLDDTGEVYIRSVYQTYDEEDKPNVGKGTFKDNVITFPIGSIEFTTGDPTDNLWKYTNSKYEFSMTLPKAEYKYSDVTMTSVAPSNEISDPAKPIVLSFSGAVALDMETSYYGENTKLTEAQVSHSLDSKTWSLAMGEEFWKTAQGAQDFHLYFKDATYKVVKGNDGEEGESNFHYTYIYKDAPADHVNVSLDVNGLVTSTTRHAKGHDYVLVPNLPDGWEVESVKVDEES